MKNANNAIVAVILVLVIAFGIAQFFAGSVQIPGQSGSMPISTTSSYQTVVQGDAAQTQVVQYVAQTPASSTPVEQGSCWTNSIAAPFRGDAWRCMAGNNISDPCFQIAGAPELLCNVNPLDPDSTSTFVLQLTQALPASQPVQGDEPADSAWLVELQDGTLCTPFTGTLPFTSNGQSAIFGCAPGALGDNPVIFNINVTNGEWTADVGNLGTSTSSVPTVISSSTIPVIEAWQ